MVNESIYMIGLAAFIVVFGYKSIGHTRRNNYKSYKCKKGSQHIMQLTSSEKRHRRERERKWERTYKQNMKKENDKKQTLKRK